MNPKRWKSVVIPIDVYQLQGEAGMNTSLIVTAIIYGVILIFHALP